YFTVREFDIFAPERGWGESLVKHAALSPQRAAKWLGGTLTAVCKKSGQAPVASGLANFERFLRCPDCKTSLTKDQDAALRCAGAAREAWPQALAHPRASVIAGYSGRGVRSRQWSVAPQVETRSPRSVCPGSRFAGCSRIPGGTARLTHMDATGRRPSPYR